jgi:hypothetical protein
VTAAVRSQVRTGHAVGDVFELLTSERWVALKAGRFRDGSTVVRREATPGGGLVLAVSRELPEGAPGFLTKLLPKDGRVVQTDEWAPDDGSGTRSGTWRVELAGAPARLGGTMRIEPVRIEPVRIEPVRIEPGGTGSAYLVVGEAKVSVPLVGGKAEAFVADMVGRLGQREGELLQTTLDQASAS